MMRTLFLQAPSFDGFDGGAGSRYQARREITSFWYPTWLAQPAALVEGSKLVDAPPHKIGLETIVKSARDFDLAVLHTSTPSFDRDVKVIEAMKVANPGLKAGLIALGSYATIVPLVRLWMAKSSPGRSLHTRLSAFPLFAGASSSGWTSGSSFSSGGSFSGGGGGFSGGGASGSW